MLARIFDRTKRITMKTSSNIHTLTSINASIMHFRLSASNTMLFDMYGNTIKGFVFTREELMNLWNEESENGLHLSLASKGEGEHAKLEVFLSPVQNLKIQKEKAIASHQGKITLPISAHDLMPLDEGQNPVLAHNELRVALEAGEKVFVADCNQQIEGFYLTKEQLKFMHIEQGLNVMNKYDNFVFVPILVTSKEGKKHLNFAFVQMKDGVMTGNFVGACIVNYNDLHDVKEVRKN